MNRSRLMPETGRRSRRLKKLSRAVSTLLFFSLVLSFLFYDAAARRFPSLRPPDREEETAAPPESSPGAEELPAPDPEIFEECGDFLYENDLPCAFDVYDALFGEEAPFTVPKGELKIVKTDLSKNPSPGDVYVKNNTPYSVTPSDCLSADRLTFAASSPVTGEEPPKVLIYHTHGTEGYAEEGKRSYASNALPRSTDITKNVVAVGKVLADTLNANGVPTLHCEIMHDQKSYNNSYTYSRQTVKDYLKQYPSIEYIFDVHRDALLNDSTVYKVLTYDESTPVAQIMLVVGTDAAGAVHPGWRENFAFAVDAQYLLTKRLENLVRPICMKKSSFNQQCMPGGGLLVEIGTCANTLNEAKEAAKILGEVLSSLIRAKE